MAGMLTSLLRPLRLLRVATIGYADGAYSSLRKRYSHSIVAGGLPEMS